MRGADPVGGREFLLRGMEGDLATGVRQRPRHVVVGRTLAVWEIDLISPADDPPHCLPAVAWVMNLSGGRVRELPLSQRLGRDRPKARTRPRVILRPRSHSDDRTFAALVSHVAGITHPSAREPPCPAPSQ